MRVSLALTRPIFPLPVAPVWSGRPWAFVLMLRTPPLPATHVREGTDHEHFSEAHCRLHPVPPINELTRAVRPRVAVKLQRLTWSASAPFRARHMPVSGQFCEATAEGSGFLPRFPVAFRPTGIGLSDHPFPPVGVGPSLRSAYRARPDLDGVSTFRTDEIRPARVPSVPRGHGVLTTGAWSPVAVAASQRQALPPALHPISRGGQLRGIKRECRLRSPVRSSPCLWPPYGAGALGLLP
jgi:hypothetical protein